MYPQAKAQTSTRILTTSLQLLALLVVIRPCFLLGQLAAMLVCGLTPVPARHFILLSRIAFVPAFLFAAWFVFRRFSRQRMTTWKTRILWCGFMALGIVISLFRVSLATHREVIASDPGEVRDDAVPPPLSPPHPPSVDGYEMPPDPDISLSFPEETAFPEQDLKGKRLLKVPLVWENETKKTWCSSLGLPVFSEDFLHQVESWTNDCIVLSPQADIQAASVLALGAFPSLSGRCFAALGETDDDSDSIHVLAIQSAIWPSEWKGRDISAAIRSVQSDEEYSSHVVLFSQSLKPLFDKPGRIYTCPPQTFRLGLGDPRHDVFFFRNGKRTILGNLEKTPESIAKSFAELSLDGILFTMADITWGELASLLSFFNEEERGTFRFYVISGITSCLHGEAFAMATLKTLHRETWKYPDLRSIPDIGKEDIE